MGIVIWFTGLSGSGKTTIANELQKRLVSLGKTVKIIDGDAIRSTLHKHLGFSRDDICINNLAIADLAKKTADHIDYVLVPIISPFRQIRAQVRKFIGQNFIELFINCPLAVCVEKDVKGLYAKAKKGEIDNMVGFSSTVSYELSASPELEIKTNEDNLEISVKKILDFLVGKGLVNL